jgi:hypothetical protein
VKGHIGRVAVALAAVAVVLLIGGVTADPDAQPPPLAVAADAAPAAVASRYPLATGSTPEEIQLVVFERAYSECASSDLELLASKYKAADVSKRGVAAVVGRAWASYFRAGRDAIRDGRDGCLLGQRDGSS